MTVACPPSYCFFSTPYAALKIVLFCLHSFHLLQRQKEGIFYVRFSLYESDMRKVDIFAVHQHPKTSLRINTYWARFSVSTEDFTFNTMLFTSSGPDPTKASVNVYKGYSCT